MRTVPQSTVYTYADDTTLIITAGTVEQLQKLAQTELNNVIRYFHTNNLVPNPTKTNYSLFHSINQPKIFHPRSEPQLHLTIQNTTLAQNEQGKLLGVIVQNNLKLDQTVFNVIKKLQPTIQSFKYANKLLPEHAMIQLYYSQIFPHLIGEISIWGTDKANAQYLQPLIRTHKHIVRLIKSLPPRSHSLPIMVSLRILTIPNLYIHRTCILMHPFIHLPTHRNRPQHNNHYLWTRDIHDYPTRYSNQTYHYIPNSTAYKYSKSKTHKHVASHSTRKGLKIWNALSEELRHETSLPTFKRKLKDYLMDTQSFRL